jgi:hypothetical protein
MADGPTYGRVGMHERGSVRTIRRLDQEGAVHRKEVYEAIKRENEQAAQFREQDLDVLSRTIAPGPQRNRLGTAVPTAKPIKGARTA